MIANKILPSFYLIELEGEIATLEHILGHRFNIKHVSMASLDFDTDIEAQSAAEDVVEFMLCNPNVKITQSQSSCEKQFNPDFYPTLDALEISEELLEQEERVLAQAAELASRDSSVSSAIITKRFDEIGDFISYKMTLYGENFNVQLKVGANPHAYILEKQKDQQEEAERQYGMFAECQQLSIH